MALGHLDDLLGVAMDSPEVKDASMKVLITPKDGWEGNYMRVIELGVDGYSPKHIHPWPHINYIIEGEGTLFLNGEENPIKAGSYAFVPPNELHQFKNTSNVVLKFICIVPEEGHK